MNSVSLLIYWAEVLGNLQILLVCFIVPAAILCVVALIIVAATEDKKIEAGAYKTLVVSFIILVIISIARIFTPSQHTMLAIAASETTGIVINSPETKQMLNTLQRTLQKNLEAK